MKTHAPPTFTKRAADERGKADHGWLDARFTFSFANYFDPDHMGFKALRVMNNDTIAPGGGFPMHPHENMEIFTYVISGQLAHEDSMGNGATIEAGDLQYMSAGSGITHSEFNPSQESATHLYQVWLHPDSPGGEPRYAERPLRETVAADSATLLFSKDGRGGSTAIRANAEISFGRLTPGASITLPASAALPNAWIQVVSGAATIGGHDLATADGLAIENATDDLVITASTNSDLLIFQLAE